MKIVDRSYLVLLVKAHLAAPGDSNEEDAIETVFNDACRRLGILGTAQRNDLYAKLADEVSRKII